MLRSFFLWHWALSLLWLCCLCVVLRWLAEVCHHNSNGVSYTGQRHAANHFADAVKLRTIIKVCVQEHYGTRNSAVAAEYPQDDHTTGPCNGHCIDHRPAFGTDNDSTPRCSTIAPCLLSARRRSIIRPATEDHCWFDGNATELGCAWAYRGTGWRGRACW